MPRFYVADIYKEMETAVLKDREFNHLTRVLRLKKGDTLSVFNGQGEEFKAIIQNITKKGALLRLTERLDTPEKSSLRIIVAQAIPKRNKMDYIVQKAAELGASKIIPLITSRSTPDLKGNRRTKKVERLKRIAIEAAKQCGRNTLLEISDITDFKDIVSYPDLPEARLILWEGERKIGLKEVLNGCTSKEVLCLIGPEGGFAEDEASLAVDNGFIPVRLGENILRAETASLAFLSIVQYELGWCPRDDSNVRHRD